MKVAILYSGGKDSNLALLKAKLFGLEPVSLITIFPKNKYSYMFQSSLIELTKLQSKALGIPQIIVETEGKKEEELKELEKAMKVAINDFEVEAIVSGAILSTYQASRIQSVAHKLGLEVFNPNWLVRPLLFLEELSLHNIDAIFVRVSGPFLQKDLLGKSILSNIPFLKGLEEKLHIAGEGGDYESFVLDMPLFSKRIKILSYHIESDGPDLHELIVDNATLEDKNV